MKKTPRQQSAFYYAVREFIRATAAVHLDRYDLARLARSAVRSGFALRDARGAVFLISDPQRNDHV